MIISGRGCGGLLICFLLFGIATIILNTAASASAQTEDGRIVITAEEISKMKALRMADVLNQVPGVKAGESSVGIHGSYKVKVLLDGRPINDPTSVHGGVKWDLIALENVEKIEILRGKGSLAHGDDASGGVILITTKKIQSFSGNVKVFGGNYDTQSYNANGRFTKKNFGGALSVAYDTTGGYKVNNDDEKRRAGAKLEYAIAESVDFAFSADHIEEEQGYSGTPDFPTPFSRVTSEMNSFSLLSRIKKVDAKTTFTGGLRHNTDVSRNLDQTLKVKNAGQDIHTSFDTGPWGNLDCGAAFAWGEAGGSTLSRQEESSVAFFGAQSIPLKRWPLTVTVGLRGNFYSEFDGSLNPEIKAAWQKKTWNANLAYSRANNAPSFHQRYNRTSSTRPNPDLGMEITDNYSLSLFSQLGDALSGSVTLFYNELFERITYVRGDDGFGQYQNIGQVTYQGVDLSLNWKITGNLTAKANYTYLEARDETNDLWLTAKPRHEASGELYFTPLEKLTLVANIDYSSKVYTRSDNSQSAPAYAIYGLRGEYLIKPFNLFGEVKNLTDETYYYVDGGLAPPQTWIIGVNWNF